MENEKEQVADVQEVKEGIDQESGTSSYNYKEPKAPVEVVEDNGVEEKIQASVLMVEDLKRVDLGEGQFIEYKPMANLTSQEYASKLSATSAFFGNTPGPNAWNDLLHYVANKVITCIRVIDPVATKSNDNPTYKDYKGDNAIFEIIAKRLKPSAYRKLAEQLQEEFENELTDEDSVAHDKVRELLSKSGSSNS